MARLAPVIILLQSLGVVGTILILIYFFAQKIINHKFMDASVAACPTQSVGALLPSFSLSQSLGDPREHAVTWPPSYTKRPMER
jgi:hypothetical protein